MRRIISIFALLALSSLTWGQCTQANPGTVCVGPLTVDPGSGNTLQSSEILVDIGLPASPPTATQYILSIVSGEIQESDNGGPYHSLVGPQGQQGIQGVPGAPGQNGVNGTNGTNGQPGQAATVQVGSVSSGTPAQVTNSGTQNAAVLNFVIPPGQTGAQGPAGNGFAIGTVITGTLTCGKSKGSIPAGFTTKGCTFTITNIQQ